MCYWKRLRMIKGLKADFRELVFMQVHVELPTVGFSKVIRTGFSSGMGRDVMTGHPPCFTSDPCLDLLWAGASGVLV